MKFIAIARDPAGIPRAWGLSDRRMGAEAECINQLDRYRQKKAMTGDPLASAKYDIEVEELPEDADE